MNHEFDTREVQPSRGDIRGDEDVARAVAQGFDRGIARGLREVAVEGGHDAAFAAGVADVFVREASFLRGGGGGGKGVLRREAVSHPSPREGRPRASVKPKPKDRD